ncbi:hypothetical protein [Actinomadura sp. HBU206391]|uniref:hypothetical protein n=1 Tax=Actinomadura sp. HBU206391 TaxID=2731692 RepID=UPI001650BFE8|nr:hypothetical protein [Actinomadura sp. HBU206391]MBC6456766.1 hypothetical protein [Actinomadura sp. HBU206391]
MNHDDAQMRVETGYVSGQMAKAFTTALSHADAATRRRAEERLRRWEQVLAGMSDGTLAIGSRTPVDGLPAWVTPEVVRGGFATGEAAAGGPLTSHEIEAARRAGVPADRRALFLHHLTDAGMAELGALLDSGRYEITVPETAALLTVAWLLRAGDGDAALTLLEEIEPFAGRLRFLPQPSDAPPPDGTVVHRETVGEVHDRLGERRPNQAVEAMNEALAVWNPFADELLAHWLETVESGQVASTEPEGWRERGSELLERYRRLAAAHTLCSKHRRPKENLAVLRTALEEIVAGRGLNQRRRGLVQHAMDSMVSRRGAPGSPRHTGLRDGQSLVAARPTHHALAQVLIARMSALPRDAGLPSTDWLTEPVTEDEEDRTGVAAGSEIPGSLRRPVDRALSAPAAVLVERGVIPSAEVLAALVPRLVASTTPLAYRDDTLRSLMAAAYRAFRKRRSLLLLNLEHQVRLEELPWVRAVSGYRREPGEARRHARVALVELGEVALRGFPATILPNPLIQELGALATRAGVEVPLVEELAADIFMGAFSGKFLRAAQLAADVLEGTLYERYYGIDYAAIRAIDDTAQHRGFQARTSETFAALCRRRAGDPGGRWVAANGMVIEQAQILTSHNLAALVHPIGVDPAPGRSDLARRAFVTVCRLVTRVHGNPRPLGIIKDAAYAWRQMLFYMALCGLEDQITLTAWIQDEAKRHPEHAVRRLAPVLAGLRHVLVGGRLDGGGAPETRPFLGWSSDGHWMRHLPARARGMAARSHRA